MVKDATESTARVELHSRIQTISVDRSRLSIVGYFDFYLPGCIYIVHGISFNGDFFVAVLLEELACPLIQAGPRCMEAKHPCMVQDQEHPCMVRRPPLMTVCHFCINLHYHFCIRYAEEE